MLKPRKKQTLLVHIGVHRTATSSVQAHLRENADALLDQGVFLVNGRGRHMALANALFDGERSPQELGEMLREQASAARRKVRSFLISDEDIALRQRLTPFAEMRRFFDVKIVVALRRQDLWLESWYFQNIKWQWNPDLAHLTFAEFMDRREDFHWIDYDRYLGQLEADFGAQNVWPFVFERGQMPDGPVAAFDQRIGLDATRLTDPPHRNSSFSPLMAEFIRRLPLDKARPKVRARLEAAFIQTDREMQRSPEESSALLMPPDQRRAVMDRYEAGNRAVARRYFKRDALFFDPLPAEDAVLGQLALPPNSEALMERLLLPSLEHLIDDLNERLP